MENNQSENQINGIHEPSLTDVPKVNEQTNNENVGNTLDGTPEKRENTRSTMAILFVLGFFAILFLCFIYAILVDATLGELKDALIGIAGALSGTLGFIVGYYYKSTLEQ